MVTAGLLISSVPSAVQILPSAAQPGSACRVTTMSAAESGRTVMFQMRFEPCVARLALVIAPLVADRAWSRRVRKLMGTSSVKRSPTVNRSTPLWLPGIFVKYPAGGGDDLSGRLSEPATGTMLTSNESPSAQPMSSTAHQ